MVGVGVWADERGQGVEGSGEGGVEVSMVVEREELSWAIELKWNLTLAPFRNEQVNGEDDGNVQRS